MAYLEVHTDDLNRSAAAWDGVSQAIAGLDPAEPAGRAAAAVRRTAFGGALAAMGEPIATAYRAVGSAIATMAQLARNSAAGYRATDDSFGQLLKSFEASRRG